MEAKIYLNFQLAKNIFTKNVLTVRTQVYNLTMGVCFVFYLLSGFSLSISKNYNYQSDQHYDLGIPEDFGCLPLERTK